VQQVNSAGARRQSGGGTCTRIEPQVTYIRLGFAVLPVALGILYLLATTRRRSHLERLDICTGS
jgi:hypothetical protein